MQRTRFLILFLLVISNSNAFSQDDQISVYLIEGGAASSPAKSAEYQRAKERLGGNPSVTVQIYDTNGVSRENPERTIFDDFSQQSGGAKIVVAYSHGVTQVRELLERGARIDALATVDGTEGPFQPIALDLGDQVFVTINYIGQLRFRSDYLYGTDHQASPESIYLSVPLNVLHEDMLEFFVDTMKGIDFLVFQAMNHGLSRHPLRLGGPGGTQTGAEAGVESKPILNVGSEAFEKLSSQRYRRKKQ